MNRRVIQTACVATLFFMASAIAAVPMKIQILDATVKNKTVPNATVIFQKQGNASIKAATNAQGILSIPMPFGVDDSSVTVIVKKPGYATMVTKGPCNNLTYALSPFMNQLDGLRIVLSWGAEPNDLDSHISYPGNHIFYRSKKGTRANLDVDDVDSYGPETITIDKKFYGQDYVYAVHNYSDGEDRTSTRLSNISKAKVFVYIGETLIRTYYPPKNKVGNLWIVFSIDGNGEFHDINQFTGTTSSGAKAVLQNFRESRNIPASAIASVGNQALAKEINKKGELAYHAGNLEQSIAYYQEAISLDANFGQAYSNLGLSFKKLNRTAEALWANRKAIALAHGDQKNVVQASSYYNIARIYEQQGKWDDALMNYTWASQRRTHSEYTKGIQRMNAKLGRH